MKNEKIEFKCPICKSREYDLFEFSIPQFVEAGMKIRASNYIPLEGKSCRKCKNIQLYLKD